MRATLALARLIRERQPRLFDFCLGLRKKDRVLEEIKWPQPRPFLHVSGRFPAAQGCIAILWPLAPHPSNRNELICWDLAHDPSQLQGMPAADIKRRIFTAASQLPEGQTRLPIKSIHINKSPVVIGNLAVLPDELAQRWGLNKSLAVQTHALAALELHWPEHFWSQVYEPYQDAGTGPGDVEEDLYGGFASAQDRRRLNQLRVQDPAIWGQRPQAFEDERFNDLIFRYRARHYPATLSAEEKADWQAFCQQRLHQPAAGGRGWEAYRQALEALQANCPPDKRAVLDALQAYQPPAC